VGTATKVHNVGGAKRPTDELLRGEHFCFRDPKRPGDAAVPARRRVVQVAAHNRADVGWAHGAAGAEFGRGPSDVVQGSPTNQTYPCMASRVPGPRLVNFNL